MFWLFKYEMCNKQHVKSLFLLGNLEWIVKYSTMRSDWFTASRRSWFKRPKKFLRLSRETPEEKDPEGQRYVIDARSGLQLWETSRLQLWTVLSNNDFPKSLCGDIDYGHMIVSCAVLEMEGLMHPSVISSLGLYTDLPDVNFIHHYYKFK